MLFPESQFLADVMEEQDLLEASASHCAPCVGSLDILPAQAKIASRMSGEMDLRFVRHCW